MPTDRRSLYPTTPRRKTGSSGSPGAGPNVHLPAEVTIDFEQPHRRWNPLTGEWVLVSAGRSRRPWGGATEPPAQPPRPRYDPECHLCPGNTRAGGDVNPEYDSTFAFTNDFALLQPDTAEERGESSPFFTAVGQAGTARVICFSPRHDLRLALLDDAEMRSVVELWAAETAELGTRYRWVQVYENSGSLMGASNPHPHGQICASTTLPSGIVREDDRQRRYFADHGAALLVDYAAAEGAAGARTVAGNEHWLAVVPFWAAWPFETLLVARSPLLRLPDLDEPGRRALAAVLQELLARYDDLFHSPFPYSMGWHGAPYDDADNRHWQLHAHFYPPLLRAGVRKHMVGYEMMAEAQRDLTPEEAAARLAALPARRGADAAFDTGAGLG